jgi:hypothetical protein
VGHVVTSVCCGAGDRVDILRALYTVAMLI